MPVTEVQRTELVNGLLEVLGEERTETLMQCILLEGRDQLATKDDLKALEIKLRGEFAEFKSEIRTELRTELAKMTRQFAFMLIGFMVTMWATMIPIALAT